MPSTYHQRTGTLERNGQTVASGYSGRGTGLNNPDAQQTAFIGPLPQGTYTIGQAVAHHPTVGNYAIPLTPASTNHSSAILPSTFMAIIDDIITPPLKDA